MAPGWVHARGGNLRRAEALFGQVLAGLDSPATGADGTDVVWIRRWTLEGTGEGAHLRRSVWRGGGARGKNPAQWRGPRSPRSDRCNYVSPGLGLHRPRRPGASHRTVRSKPRAQP